MILNVLQLLLNENRLGWYQGTSAFIMQLVPDESPNRLFILQRLFCSCSLRLRWK